MVRGWKTMGFQKAMVVVLASIILMGSIGPDFESGAYWAVEVGDVFEFRAQYLLCNRSLDYAEREMQFDEILKMEITSLGNLSLAYHGWIPTDYQSMCGNTLEFPDGTDVRFSENPLVLGAEFTTCAAMPIGNWTGANEELYLANLDVMDPYNHSFTLIEDQETWGYTYRVPEINMTDTRIWSKIDGSLLILNVTNGINERFVSTELAFDLLLERYQPLPSVDITIIEVSIVIVVLVIVLFTLFKKRG
jgi:hypothetical protein